MKYLIAYDLGTGGNKTVLYDEEGNLLASSFEPYETFYPQQYCAEQDPMDWWNAIVNGTTRIINETKINPRDVKCLCISGHGIGIVPIDKKGNLTRKNTLIWSDGRAQKEARDFLAKFGEKKWYDITGSGIRPDSYSIFKLMWIRDNEPEVFKSTYKFLATKDFINMKLTGNIIGDYSDASFSGLYDLNKWEYSDEIIEAAKLPQEKLPDLYPSTHIVGTLLADIAKIMNLVEGIPVVAGGYDGSCTALGAGNYTSGRFYNYIGSSSWISACADKPVYGQNLKTYIYAHVVPDMFNSTVGMYSAGSSWQWVRNILCKEEIFASEIAQNSPYELMENEAKNSPIGANNMIFIPSLMGGGIVNPSPNVRGAFLGLDLSKNKGDILRASLEGISIELRMLLDIFRSQDFNPNEIRLVGGGSKSPFWRQMLADLYGIDVILTTVGQEAAALGAAVVGGVGVGVWKDFSIIDSIAKNISVSKPDKNTGVKYNDLLSVYRKVFEKVAEIGEIMAKIDWN